MTCEAQFMVFDTANGKDASARAPRQQLGRVQVGPEGEADLATLVHGVSPRPA
jgi:hypothetical protein